MPKLINASDMFRASIECGGCGADIQVSGGSDNDTSREAIDKAIAKLKPENNITLGEDERYRCPACSTGKNAATQGERITDEDE